jgi:hypothetical protein
VDSRPRSLQIVMGGEIVSAASPETLLVLCGDHPVHVGKMNKAQGPNGMVQFRRESRYDTDNLQISDDETGSSAAISYPVLDLDQKIKSGFGKFR